MSLDISNITADIVNDKPLSIGGLYGWKTSLMGIAYIIRHF